MRLLDLEASVRVIDGASNTAIRDAQAAIPRESLTLRLDWLEYGVQEGFYRTAEVLFNGRHVSTVFYAMDGPRVLRIHGVHSRANDLELSDVHELAFRRLAGENGAQAVQFETKRGGLIRKAVLRGYEICGVILRREITGDPVDPERGQDNQRNMSSSKSSSSNASSTTQTATNQQVAAESGGVGIGANSSGNQVNITTSDVNALVANENVSEAAISSNADVTKTALASGIQSLQLGSAVAQMGVASNTTIAGEAIAGGDEETHDTLEAAQNLGGAALAQGQNVATAGLAAATDLANTVSAASLHDLGTSLAYSAETQANANSTVNSTVNSSLSAILASQANSSDLIQSVVNSNTAALENSNTLAYQTAAGAVSQEGQIAGNAVGGNSNVQPFSVSGLIGSNPTPETYIIVGVAVAAAVVVYLLVKNEL